MRRCILWWRPPRSLTARLSLMLAGVVIAILAGVGTVLHDSLDRQLRARDSEELEGKLQLVRSYLQEEKSLARVQRSGVLRHALLGHDRLHVVLVDEAAHVVFAASGGGATEDAVRSGRVKVVPSASGPRLVATGVPFVSATDRVRLAGAAQPALWAMVALETPGNRTFLREHLQNLITVLITGALLAGLTGYLAIRHGLAPLKRITRAAQQVSASRLERRIPCEATPTELAPLVQEFNAMLGRLADSFRRLSEFSSDLAHELRTPIHSLLGHAQVALSRPRSRPEYQNALETIVEEGEHLARIVKDMLFLAQADNASLSLRREHVDLRAELHNIVSFFQPLAEERQLALEIEGAAVLEADRNMVQRAVTNLLSNAVRHATSGTTVLCRVLAGDEEVCVDISNTGIPIPKEAGPRIFDRFYRADGLRNDRTGGSGLGLAIVKSIMDLHGGTVELVASEAGVTTFRLQFPAGVRSGEPGSRARTFRDYIIVTASSGSSRRRLPTMAHVRQT